MHEALSAFSPVIGTWFERHVGVPTPAQVLGWPHVAAHRNTLILAPTGSGKTLAAFLAAIDFVAKLLQGEEGTRGVQILYVSPLKSLANDVQKNLVTPLEQIERVAEEMKARWPQITVAVRTGDTTPAARAQMLRTPPHILITTPESLNLLLTTRGRSILTDVRFVIVDEVHALAGNKRGVFLSLVLERLEELRQQAVGMAPGAKRTKIAPGVFVKAEPAPPLVRIGLSATARPEEVIANWLGGFDDDGKPRPVEIARAGQRKRLDLQVMCPFWGEAITDERFLDPEGRPLGKSHWPQVTKRLRTLVKEHRSTLIFANSRRLVERLAAELLDSADRLDGTKPEPLTLLPHHGSISKEVRLETEQALKRGELQAVIATNSLELGIDVGALDLVVQVDSPGTVAGALQRVGRAGHLEKATAKGRLLARRLGELPSLAALTPLMVEGLVEELRVPQNCLDVLSQQVCAACVVAPQKRARLLKVIRRSAGYAKLSDKQFESVVQMLSRRADRVTATGLKPRISFDRVNDELIALPGTAKVAVTNSGVIADTGYFAVYAIDDRPAGEDKDSNKARGKRIGELDEEFVFETKEGDRILLGSQVWRVASIDADRVLVKRTTPGTMRMPFWRGERAPRSELLGEAIARFNSELEKRLDGVDAAREWLIREHHFDDQAADALAYLYRRQRDLAAVPTHERVVIEHFVDKAGEPVIAVFCPLGSRINYALRIALEARFAARRLPAQIIHSDDGLLIRPPVEVGEIPENPLAFLRSSDMEGLIVDQLESSALFGLRFRMNAARALMLPRMSLNQRTPLWQQRLRARHLLALVKQQRNFPIIVETYRECLQDVLAVDGARTLLEKIETGDVAVSIVRNAEPSPFAVSAFSEFQQEFMYAQDDPLGPTENEPSVDPAVIDSILQRRQDAAHGAAGWSAQDEATLLRRITGSSYPARTPEELLEKIEAAGPVDLGEADDPRWGAWVVDAPAAMLKELMDKRRLLRVSWADETDWRWLATENLAMYVAARGLRPRLKGATYEELPPALLKSELDKPAALRAMVEQAIKRQPTFTRAELQGRFAWAAEAIGPLLNELLREGVVQQVQDERMALTEFVDQLRTIALRRERQATALADVDALQRHLLHWHKIDRRGNGIDAIEDALDMLVGVGRPLDTWLYDILPARVADFVPNQLDAITRAGHWVAVGGEDESVAFWPRHWLGLREPVAAPTLSENAQRVLETLKRTGASFMLDLQMQVPLAEHEIAAALRALFFAGLISGDSTQTLMETFAAAEASDEGRKGADAAKRPRIARGWWKNRTMNAGALGGRFFTLMQGVEALDALAHAQRITDRAERLLRRHGFVCRELTDTGDGPWRDNYEILTRFEWAGTARRGYFVEGITGSQFALPGVDLASPVLQRGQQDKVFWLSMLDPANIYSHVRTKWVSDLGESARVPRVAGSWLAIVDGLPVLAAVAYGQRLVPLAGDARRTELALGQMHLLLDRLPRATRPHLQVKFLDQTPILESPAASVLQRQGFTRDTQSLRLYRQYMSSRGQAAEVPEPNGEMA